MNIEDAINDYLRYARVEVGLSDKTIVSYQSWLRHYNRWLQGKGNDVPTVDGFSLPNLQDFYYYCREERNHRPRTVLGTFSALRAFGEFLVLRKGIERNFARDIRLPKKDAAERTVPTDEEVTAIWEACELISPPSRGILFRAVLACFAYAGLRPFEAIALHLKDCRDVELKHDGIKEQGMSLIIRHGKGEKSRTIVMPQTGAEAVRAWIAIRGETEQEWLWVTGRNRHMGERVLVNMMKELRRAARLSEATYIAPQSMRHNYATRLYRKTRDLYAVKTALGHTRLSTTEIYLHVGEELLMETAHLAEISKPALEKTASALPPRQRRYNVMRRNNGASH